MDARVFALLASSTPRLLTYFAGGLIKCIHFTEGTNIHEHKHFQYNREKPFS